MTQITLGVIAGAVIAVCALVIWAYRTGRRAMDSKHKAQARDRHDKTTERIRNAPVFTDPDTARRWLRARDPGQR